MLFITPHEALNQTASALRQWRINANLTQEDLSQKSAEKKLMVLAQCKVTMPSDADIATAVNTSRPNGETGCDAMSDMARYTQGLMDLGATVCTRHQPACADCPLAGRCEALRSGNQLTLPFKSRRTQRSTVRWWLLVLRLPGGRVWLAQRPATGNLARRPVAPARRAPAWLQASQIPDANRDRGTPRWLRPRQGRLLGRPRL